MGMINSVIDMIKAGTVSGIYVTFCYIITVIVLIIMKIFKAF